VSVLRSFRLWLVALLAVAAWALLVSPTTSGLAARIAHLETLVKCPSCQDLSVAQSTSTSSLAVRDEIAAMVHEGRSDTAILTTIEDAYGPQILLSPSSGGLGVLLWLGPLVVVVLLVANVVRLRRRR
jgi:cytochrome c-type biogenesis protein CcmH